MPIFKTVRFSLIILIINLLSFTPSLAQKDNLREEPGQLVVATIDRGMKVLKNPDLQDYEKLDERREVLWNIIEPVFDFNEISRRALGRYWNERSNEEKEKFTELFTNILKDTYMGKSDSYADQEIIYLRENIQGNRSRVQTNFITSNGKKISVDFNMKKVDNEWKIYDIIIEGVSLVGNYRTQFNSILAKSTFDELIEKLKEKSDEIVEVDTGV